MNDLWKIAFSAVGAAVVAGLAWLVNGLVTGDWQLWIMR